MVDGEFLPIPYLEYNSYFKLNWWLGGVKTEGGREGVEQGRKKVIIIQFYKPIFQTIIFSFAEGFLRRESRQPFQLKVKVTDVPTAIGKSSLVQQWRG